MRLPESGQWWHLNKDLTGVRVGSVCYLIYGWLIGMVWLLVRSGMVVCYQKRAWGGGDVLEKQESYLM